MKTQHKFRESCNFTGVIYLFIFSQATKNKQEVTFYSIPEFDEWKKQTENYKTWHVKYYKGLFFKWLNISLHMSKTILINSNKGSFCHFLKICLIKNLKLMWTE